VQDEAKGGQFCTVRGKEDWATERYGSQNCIVLEESEL